MHNYGVPPEIVRLTLVIAIFIGTLIYERWHVTGGAVVVAGYLALFVTRPMYIIITVGLGLVTYQVVQKLISPRVFLYGRRRLAVMVITGMVLQLMIGAVAYFLSSSATLSQSAPWLAGLYGVGFLLPGLTAQDMERQGIRTTLMAVLGTALVTFFIASNLELLKSFLPTAWNILAPEDTISYSYSIQLLIPAAILSVLFSVLLFEWRGIRSGGFVSAAYTALFFLQPLHLVFIIGISFLVNFFVTRLLIPYIPIFGRTKFAVMVLTGMIFTWLFEQLIALLTNNAFIPFAGFSIISPVIVSLIANDGEQQGMGKTLLGVTICMITVFVIIKGVELLFLG